MIFSVGDPDDRRRLHRAQLAICTKSNDLMDEGGMDTSSERRADAGTEPIEFVTGLPRFAVRMPAD